MTNLPPRDSDSSSLGFDEWIGIIIALGVIGAILIAVLGQGQKGFNLKQLLVSPTAEPKTKASEETTPRFSQPNQSVTEETVSLAPTETVPSTVLPSPSKVETTQQPSNQTLPRLSKAVPLAPIASTTPKTIPPSAPPAPKETPIKPISFADVPENYWAAPYITALVQRDIMNGFPDKTFKPNSSINRAEFAALLDKAFNQQPTLQTPNFKDISSEFWAWPAIQGTSKTNFLRGYPNYTFQPQQPIPRVQVFVALASGLGLKATQTSEDVLKVYQDASQIPKYAQEKVNAATQAGIVVNYPNPEFLNPNQEATRAEVAAIVYQALVEAEQAPAISSKYVVKP